MLYHDKVSPLPRESSGMQAQDACSAVAVSSAWAKAHWRKGVALRGLKRFPDAVQAFHQASALLKGALLFPTADLRECTCILGRHILYIAVCETLHSTMGAHISAWEQGELHKA